MRWLSKIRIRRHVLDQLRTEIFLKKIHIGICERRLERLDVRDHRAKKVWSRILDLHQELVELQRRKSFLGVYWILTGNRWLVFAFLKKQLCNIRQAIFGK